MRQHLIALFAALSVSSAAFLALAEDEPPPPLKFAWPIPSKATVVERIMKRGHGATTRYTMTVERREGGDDLTMRLSNFEFLELEGRPASDPAVAAQIAIALPMSKHAPDVLIGPDGRVKDLLHFEETIEAMLNELEEIGTPEQKTQIPGLRAQLKRPEVRDQKKVEAARPWQAWVGEWAGRAIADGGKIETRLPLRCPDGTEADAPTVITRVPSTEGPGLVKLVRETRLEGEDAKPAFDRWMEKAKALPGGAPAAKEMRLMDRVVTITDPATLRPKRVIREELYVLVLPLSDDAVQGERHEYEFTWEEPAKPAEPTPSGR